MKNTRKRSIYVIMSGPAPLHAVCTERQAKRFIASYTLDDCRLFCGNLNYHKIMLIPPRNFTEKEKSAVRSILK